MPGRVAPLPRRRSRSVTILDRSSDHNDDHTRHAKHQGDGGRDHPSAGRQRFCLARIAQAPRLRWPARGCRCRAVGGAWRAERSVGSLEQAGSGEADKCPLPDFSPVPCDLRTVAARPVRLHIHTRLSGQITILVTRVVMAIGSAGRPCQRCGLAASPAGRTPRWVVVFGSGWRLRLSCRWRHLPSLRALRPLLRSAHRTCSLRRPSPSRARLSVG
jgi:hypothetical protein